MENGYIVTGKKQMSVLLDQLLETLPAALQINLQLFSQIIKTINNKI